MTEAEFWMKMEFLACGELERIASARGLGLWCDGIEARDYRLTEHPAKVLGEAWIAYGQKNQERWRFELKLRQRARDRVSIVWSAALPTEADEGWLEIDVEAKFLRLLPPAPRAAMTRSSGPGAKAGVDEDLDGCLELARESRLPVEVLGAGLPEDRFLRLVLAFTQRFGDPDHPGDYDWRGHFGARSGMFVVWDFDFYAVTVSLLNGEVLLQWHRPAEPNRE